MMRLISGSMHSMEKTAYDARRDDLQCQFDVLIDSFPPERQHNVWRALVNLQNDTN